MKSLIGELTFSSLSRNVLRCFQLDWPIAFSLLNSFRGLVGAPLVALLIMRHFSPEVQGFYYTFSSLVGLQVFAELGLGTVIVQFASHEWSRLQLVDGEIAGPLENRSRLISLGRLALRWYLVAGFATAVLLSVVGYHFFESQRKYPVRWVMPWLSLSAVVGCRLALTPLFNLLEGCGQILQVNRYRLLEGSISIGVCCGAILLHASLWTAFWTALATFLFALYYLARHQGRFFRSFMKAPLGPLLSWKHDLLPMQWRIALSWACGYFAFQLFTPLVFHYQGPRAAGQMGMTWSLASGVGAIASAWISTKAPLFGALVAKNEFGKLDRLALRAGASATVVAACGALGVLLMLWLIERFLPYYSMRLLPPVIAAPFLAGAVLMQIPSAQASYLRAHKREPFLSVSVVAAIFVAATAWYAASHGSMKWLAGSYLAVSAFVTLPLGTIVLVRCRRRWHTSATTSAAG